VLLADTPATWDDGSGMSTLNALLIFVGGPLLIIAVITLLVMAPSLAKGPRYRPSQQWDAEPEWFGGPDEEIGAGADASDRRQLEASSTAKRGDDHDETGGASASW
jgi:hypothetical protein